MTEVYSSQVYHEKQDNKTLWSVKGGPRLCPGQEKMPVPASSAPCPLSKHLHKVVPVLISPDQGVGSCWRLVPMGEVHNPGMCELDRISGNLESVRNLLGLSYKETLAA